MDMYHVYYMFVLYGHTYSKSQDQPGKAANPARGQLCVYSMYV